MELPPTIEFKVNKQLITIQAFIASETTQNLHQQQVNIIASGPSIADLDFSKLLDTATIFVNGSLSLSDQYSFTNVVGYVISDARFIKHQPQILKKFYSGQPLYATLAVFEAMTQTHPDILLTHHKAMRILYPVDRPWGVKTNKPWFGRLNFRRKTLNKKTPLVNFANSANFVIDRHHKPSPIGVSLDISQGFVEGGTVAYVATQLAFSRQAKTIHLYGIDLLNSNQPRFYENSQNSAPSKLDKAINDRIVPSFNLLGKTYKDHGVAVINHSPISKDLFTHLHNQIK